jgi:hypothetical protein
MSPTAGERVVSRDVAVGLRSVFGVYVDAFSFSVARSCIAQHLKSRPEITSFGSLGGNAHEERKHLLDAS